MAGGVGLGRGVVVRRTVAVGQGVAVGQRVALGRGLGVAGWNGSSGACCRGGGMFTDAKADPSKIWYVTRPTPAALRPMANQPTRSTARWLSSQRKLKLTRGIT